jgi:hypothetical protein
MMGALVVPSHLSSGTQNEFLNRLQLSDFLLDCSGTEVLVKYSVYSDSKMVIDGVFCSSVNLRSYSIYL